MSQALLDKLRRSREAQVEAGGHVFTLRRPTDAEAVLLGSASPLDLVHRFITGWDLTELDVIPGGTGEIVPFDAAIWSAWVDDRPDLWGPLSEAIIAAYRRHTETREAAEKN